MSDVKDNCGGWTNHGQQQPPQEALGNTRPESFLLLTLTLTASTFPNTIMIYRISGTVPVRIPVFRCQFRRVYHAGDGGRGNGGAPSLAAFARRGHPERNVRKGRMGF